MGKPLQAVHMKPIVACAFLVGCQSVKPPDGPCELPPVTHQLGDQTWQTPGAKTWDEPAQCLRAGGIYQTSMQAMQLAQYRHKAQLGDTQAMIQLGEWALAESPPDFESATEYFQRAWALGDRQAAWFLAQMAREGLGQPANALVATNFLEQAAGGIKLVPATALAGAQLQQQALVEALAEQQSQQAQLDADLRHVQAQWEARPRTTLYRFDLGGSGGCGIDLDWRAFGEGAAGLSLAVDAFEHQYAGQGWLWLDTAGPTDSDLWEQTYREILQSSPAWLVTNGEPIATHLPRIVAHDSPALGVSYFGPSVIEWRCEL